VRLLLDFEDGSRLALLDPRALAVVTLHAPGIDPLPTLGPEATDPQFNARWLRRAMGARRGAIKPALLDQRLVAGVGNIYASEALWHARLDPRASCAELDDRQLAAVVAGIKHVLRRALARPERYYGSDGATDSPRFKVYDREGGACPRCRAPIERIVQAARSTFCCPHCQG
jgi:formamidopyrimidine-DNA glycosylase